MNTHTRTGGITRQQVHLIFWIFALRHAHTHWGLALLRPQMHTQKHRSLPGAHTHTHTHTQAYFCCWGHVDRRLQMFPVFRRHRLNVSAVILDIRWTKRKILSMESNARHFHTAAFSYLLCLSGSAGRKTYSFFIACHYCVIYFMKPQQLWKRDTIIVTQSWNQSHYFHPRCFTLKYQ